MSVVFSPILNGWQGFTSSGIPLNAGLIYTYAAGGTTPQATYTTNAGNVANANPIVLGSDGRPPNEIWLTAGVSYRFDLKDSLGNLIKTYDNINASGGIPYEIVNFGNDLAAAVTAIGSTSATLFINSAVTLASNVTVPVTLSLVMFKGGIITTTGYTLTINGAFEADYFQVFTGSGTVVFGALVDHVKVDWWQVNTTPGTTDMGPAILKAINTLKPVKFSTNIYGYNTVTVPASTSNVELRGERGGLPELRYLAATGNGFAFAGEADNFSIRWFNMTSPSNSTGAAFYSNQLSTAPIRDFISEGVSISGFLGGHDFGGVLGYNILGPCRMTGQGKAVTGGYGIKAGTDGTHSGNLCNIQGEVYIANYEINLYNVTCSPTYMHSGLLGTAKNLIRNDSGQLYFRGYMEDSGGAPASVGVNGQGGYTFFEPLRASTLTAANLISDANHRTHIAGSNPTRCSGYRSAAVSINGGPTQIVYDTAIENTDTWLNTTTGQITIQYAGFYRVTAPTTFTATAAAQTIAVTLYKNNSAVTQSTFTAHSSVAAVFGATLMWELWCASGDVLDIRVSTSANLALSNGAIAVSNLGT